MTALFGSSFLSCYKYIICHLCYVNAECFNIKWFLTQYHRLNALMDMFDDLNFTVLGFPCNQFGLQSPGKFLCQCDIKCVENACQVFKEFVTYIEILM